MSKPTNDKVFHYTSIEVLKKIIENNEIWAPSASTMNDRDEVILFVKALENALLDDLDDSYRSKIVNYFKEIKERLKSEYPYIASFSKKYDDAAQWERYGDNGQGVCISFDIIMLNKICNSNISEKHLCLGNVFYDFDIREHKHYKGLKQYFETDNDPDFEKEKGRMDNILLRAYFYKHNAFDSEHELRLSTIWTKYPKEPIAKIENEVIRGETRKTMKLSLKELCNMEGISIEDLLIEITIGPRSKQQISDLTYFLKTKGCTRLSTNIVNSQCPLR